VTAWVEYRFVPLPEQIFADIARQKTDNIYNLSKTLGHSSLKVTEAYLSSFDEKAVDDTLDSMFK